MGSRTIACIEVGGSGLQTVTFADRQAVAIVDGIGESVAHADLVLMAVPGIIDGDRVVGASNLGWYDVDPAAELGLARPADLVLNDAEAAALGEAALRGIDDLTFVGLGTGVGGAIVRDRRLAATNLFGHDRGYSDTACVCGQIGCLETVAAGWALPDPLDATHPGVLADAVSRAIGREPLASVGPIVVTGGLARRYPSILDELALRIPGRPIEPTAAPDRAKSAAAWGLVRMALDLDPARP